jgi:hypothetical protein
MPSQQIGAVIVKKLKDWELDDAAGEVICRSIVQMILQVIVLVADIYIGNLSLTDATD